MYFAIHVMNFLSHYYFDRYTTNCYYILGIVMPDLLKNADKNSTIHPEKLQQVNNDIQQIINGCKKHLEVDRYFHNAVFFKHHAHQLKLELLPAIIDSPVKPFFLSHIGVELLLDNLLLTNQHVAADDFYAQLNYCSTEVIRNFLFVSGISNPEVFIHFFEGFKQNRYLRTYTQTEQLTYALKRVCMRIWKDPFTPAQETAITQVINNYRQKLQPNFMDIFKEIEFKLTGH